MRNITRNLKLKGSVPAEINHSSIVSNFEPSVSWTITKNLVKQMERQQDRYNQQCKMEDTLTLKSKLYESKYDGQIGIEDKEARLALSTYANDSFWSKSLCAMKIYQHRQCNIQQR